jgi:hypothetical protein
LNEPKGENYKKLIEYAFELCDEFLFIKHSQLSYFQSNEESIDICYNLIKSKRKPKEVGFLYLDLYSYGYLTFKEKVFLEALLKDSRFIITDEYVGIPGEYVSVNRSGNRKK